MKSTFLIIFLFFFLFTVFANEDEQNKRRKLLKNKHQGIAFGISAGKYFYADLAYYKTKYIVVTTIKHSYGMEFGKYNDQLVIAPKASIHLKFFKYIQVGGQALFYYNFDQVVPVIRTEVGYVINRKFEVRAAMYTNIWTNELSSHLNKYHISFLYFLKLK